MSCTELLGIEEWHSSTQKVNLIMLSGTLCHRLLWHLLYQHSLEREDNILNIFLTHPLQKKKKRNHLFEVAIWQCLHEYIVFIIMYNHISDNSIAVKLQKSADQNNSISYLGSKMLQQNINTEKVCNMIPAPKLCSIICK